MIVTWPSNLYPLPLNNLMVFSFASSVLLFLIFYTYLSSYQYLFAFFCSSNCTLQWHACLKMWLPFCLCSFLILFLFLVGKSVFFLNCKWCSYSNSTQENKLRSGLLPFGKLKSCRKDSCLFYSYWYVEDCSFELVISYTRWSFHSYGQ